MMFTEAILSMRQDDFEFVLKNGKRCSVIMGHDFDKLIYSSWKFLKETIPDLVKKGKFGEMVFECFIDRGIFIFKNDIDLLPIKEVMSFFLWICDERESIARMESEYLSSEPDMDLQMAGISELNIFGDLNTIDALAGGDVTKYEAIKLLPYSVIFDKTYKDLIERKVQKKYAKLKEHKKKNGHS